MADGNFLGKDEVCTCGKQGNVIKCPVHTPKLKQESILQEAEHIINGQRRDDYGGALESFTRIASLWSVVLGVEVTAHQVVLCMVQLKVARAMQGYHRDSYVDIAGYAGCAEKVENELHNSD